MSRASMTHCASDVFYGVPVQCRAAAIAWACEPLYFSAAFNVQGISGIWQYQGHRFSDSFMGWNFPGTKGFGPKVYSVSIKGSSEVVFSETCDNNDRMTADLTLKDTWWEGELRRTDMFVT